jgi:hypothetical protein
LKTNITSTLSEIIQYDFVSGPSSKAIIRTQYQTGATFVDFPEDLTDRTIDLGSENSQYGVFSLMPPVQTMDMSLINYGQRYNPANTASPYHGILKKNMLVKCWSGYELTTAQASGTVTDNFGAARKYFHTQNVSSPNRVILSEASYTGTIGTYANPLYDSEHYDDSFYAGAGYYEHKVFLGGGSRRVRQLKITTNSNKMSLNYYTGNISDYKMVSNGWQTLATGANVITIDSKPGDKYFRYVVRWNASEWGGSDAISLVSYRWAEYASLFPQGVFVIDDPQYADATVKISGRDYLKKALETNVNIKALGSIPVTDAIDKVLDACLIPHATHATIATTVNFSGSAAEYVQKKTGWQVLSMLMDAANAGNDDIRFKFTEDGRAKVQRIPTDLEADWTMHYRFNVESLNQSNDSDKQLQRITAYQKQMFVSPEVTIGVFTGTASTPSLHLAYATFAKYDTAGNYSTAATHYSATSEGIFVSYIDNKTNGVGQVSTEVGRTNTGINFTLTGATAGVYPYNITVLGCAPSKKVHKPYAERGHAANILAKNGVTHTVENTFMDAASLKAYADYSMGVFGNPELVLSAEMVANPLLEIGDNILNFNQWAFDANIYGIYGITENWNNPALKHTLKMRDRGFDLTQFIYDRREYRQRMDRLININILKYDTGMVWDQDIAPTATADSNTYADRYDKQFA